MKQPTCEIRISDVLYGELHRHLFPGDHDEHGAVLRAGLCQDADRVRLLVRDFVPADFGTDYVEGQIGYRALAPKFIHKQITVCRDERLVYLQYCSDTHHRHWFVLLMKRLAAVADVEVAHLALDAARVEAPAAADAAALCNLVKQLVAPLRQSLRGEGPQLAASCV